MLVSELGGSRGLLDKMAELGVDYPLSREEARSLTERIALALQGALLVQGAPASTADAFCASRLGGDAWGRTFGTLPKGVDVGPLLTRALAD
jgi:putative acyl-CoA dehydrogenase